MLSLQVLLVGLYLLLCVLYWVWSALQLAAELRDVLDVKHFINNKLGISDRQVCVQQCALYAVTRCCAAVCCGARQARGGCQTGVWARGCWRVCACSGLLAWKLLRGTCGR